MSGRGGACMAGGVHGRVACMAGGMRGGGVCVAGETATAADGTHPTGMHSCLVLIIFSLILVFRKQAFLILCTF